MLVVEDAFDVLRNAGLSSSARHALDAILGHVMDDFDRPGKQWSQRARYRALLDSLGGTCSASPSIIPSSDEHDLIPASSSDDMVSAAPGPQGVPPSNQSSGEIVQAVLDAMRLASIHPDAHRPLSSFLQEYLVSLRKKGRGEQYLSEIGTKIRVFACTVGDKPVHEYGKGDLLSYRDLIDQMPVDAVKHLRTDDPVTAIALNKKRLVPLAAVSPTTVNSKYLTVVRGLFGYLVDRGILPANPVAGVKSEQVLDAEDALDVEVRLPFPPEMEVEILRKSGKKPKSAADYWWPRFNLRQGLRLQEFTQLCVSDFRVLHGRLCIDLLHFDYDGDPCHGIRRPELRLKSDAARRIMPVAHALLDDGVIAFIERRRREGGPNARLFPHELADRFGNTSSALSKRANRLVRSVTGDPRYVAYSARHTFARRCDEAGIPRHIRHQLMGHEPEESADGKRKASRGRHVSSRYGSPLPTPDVFDWFDKIQFCVDPSAPSSGFASQV